MTDYKAMRAGFEDELSKIAGELQGHTRIGRKPIGIERLLERELESEVVPSDVAPSGISEDTEKVSAPMKPATKALALVGGGAAAYHLGRQANDDRKMGKAMRKQQQF